MPTEYAGWSRCQHIGAATYERGFKGEYKEILRHDSCSVTRGM